MSTLKIAIVLGSTRPGRNGEAVAKWVYGLAKQRTDAYFELLDLLDFNLPLLDEPASPMPVSYTHLRAHETVLDLVCRLLLENKKYNNNKEICHTIDTN